MQTPRCAELMTRWANFDNQVDARLEAYIAIHGYSQEIIQDFYDQPNEIEWQVVIDALAKESALEHINCIKNCLYLLDPKTTAPNTGLGFPFPIA